MDEKEKKELLLKGLQAKIKEYELPETCEKIPKSNQSIEVKWRKEKQTQLLPLEGITSKKKRLLREYKEN